MLLSWFTVTKNNVKTNQRAQVVLFFYLGYYHFFFYKSRFFCVCVCEELKAKDRVCRPCRSITLRNRSAMTESSSLTSSIEIDFNHLPHNTFNPFNSPQAPSDLHRAVMTPQFPLWFSDGHSGLKLTAHSRVTPQRYWAVMRRRPRPEKPLNHEESIEKQSTEKYKIEG